MIYGDPDYNVGIDYAGKNYTTKFSKFMEWYIELTKECMRVLKDEGNIMMMNYPKPNSYLRVNYLEDVATAINEYVWVYNTNIGQSKKFFTTAHRSILHITKSKENNFYKANVSEDYQNPGPVRQKKFKRMVIKALSKNDYKLEFGEDPNRKELYQVVRAKGPQLWDEINKGHIEKIELDDTKKKIVLDCWERTDKELEEVGSGRMPYSWFYHDLVKNVSKEKSIHAAQIPKAVSRKLIECCTMPGDTVLVLFGGSGSECEVCKEGGRDFITAELHKTYYDLIKKRIEQGEIPKEYWHKSRTALKKNKEEDSNQTKITE